MTAAARLPRLVLFALAVAAPAWAQDPSAPTVVPIGQEPRHKLVLNTPMLRVFDTVIEPGDTSLYHKHERDAVYVSIAGSQTESQELGKAPESRAPFDPGKVWFRDNAEKPFVHRVVNTGKTPARVIDVELVAPAASEQGALPPLPQAYQPVLDNARVRVSRLMLRAGEETEMRAWPRPRVLVVVQASRMLIDWKPNHTVFDPDPGDLHLMERPSEQKIRNSGNQTLELIQIEVK